MARPQGTAGESQVRRKALVINYLVWAVAVIVMVVSATTTANLMVQHHNSYAQGLALGLAVDASIAVSLIGDQLLQQSGRRSGWGTALRWITAVMSLLLNCSQSVQDGDVLGVALHAIPVVLLTSLTEAAQDYQLMLGRTSAVPDTVAPQEHPHTGQPVTDDAFPRSTFGGHDSSALPANRPGGTDHEYPNPAGGRAPEVGTALAEMLTERGIGPIGPWAPELWDQAVDCAVRYHEDTGRPVRVDDIQELGIGRNRAVRLRQDVLAHLARADAHAGPESRPPADDLVLAPLDLVIRHRDDTLARLRVTPDPENTETLRRHLIDAIDNNNVAAGVPPVRIEDYALDVHRADDTSSALLTFTASGAR